MNYGSNVWGSKAWHLLHAFSKNKISNDKKHNYYLFYKSFVYILPCIICREHYADILYIENTLEEESIDKEYLIKWVFDTHNIVNKTLNKPQYNFDIFLKNIKKINHNDIFFILKCFILNIDYNNISLYKYDQIYNFFINFCILYPEKERRKVLKKIIKSPAFVNIYTPNQFKLWFVQNLIILKNIICET